VLPLLPSNAAADDAPGGAERVSFRAAMATYVLKVRAGPKVERSKHDDLDAALRALEDRATELQHAAPGRAIDLKVGRRFEPVQQVTARLELSGPGPLRAGVDVRGDGSVESWTGRFRRELIEQRRGESALDALRRVTGGG
jgi:hypothetical protein